MHPNYGGVVALPIILLHNTLIKRDLNKASILPKMFEGLLIEKLMF